MKRTMLQGGLVAVALAALAVSCSDQPETLLTPSNVTETATFANPDGSTVKATAPTGLSPNGGTLDTRRPTLSFTNASGRFAAIGFSYELELQDASSAVVYTRIIGQSSGTSSHTVETELPYATTYWWRVRSRLDTQAGPWSGFAQVRTPDPPPPPTTTTTIPPTTTTIPPTQGGLPFPIPAACGPAPSPANRLPCVLAVAALSDEWARCARGIGINCHRFSRQVVYALAQSDPNYKMIQAAPGGNACNCSACGPSDGTMFREDTTVYNGNQVFDMIGGAGGPTPSLGWSAVGAPRPGDIPTVAPLCP